MQSKLTKSKPKGHSFYLKISFSNKSKKFIVRNPKQISFKQIRCAFTPPISTTNIQISILQNGVASCILNSQDQLIHKISSMQIPDGGNVQISIVEEKEKARDSSQGSESQEQLPLGVKKVRSRSQQIQIQYRTSSFIVSYSQLEATQEFLYQSVTMSQKTVEQAEKMVHDAQKKLFKIKEQSRQTDVGQLMKFLSDD